MQSTLRFVLPALAVAAAMVTLSSGQASAQAATSLQASCPTSSAYGYPGAYGYGYQSGQVACQVTNQGQPLYAGAMIYVSSAAANGTSPSECDGVTAPDYTTQNVGTGSLSLNAFFSGPTGCAFTVTSGTLQPGDQVGTEQLPVGSIPPGGGTISVNALVCTDPSCGGLNSGLLGQGYGYSPYQPAYPTSSYQPYPGYQPSVSYSYSPPPPPPPSVVYRTVSSSCTDADCDGDGSTSQNSSDDGHHHRHHDH